MKKLLIATIVLALAFGASRLVLAEDDGSTPPADPNTPAADANAIAE
jgi:hypothetical protein